MKKLRKPTWLAKTAHRQTTATVVVASLLAMSLVVLVGTAVVAHRRDQAHILADTAVYTVETATSRSGVEIVVDGVWRNQAGNVAAVVMHANQTVRRGETSALPFDASSYGLYLSGGSPNGELTPSTQTIAGDWVMFGSTGYMAAVIQTAGGFAGQPFHEKVLEITVRSNTVLEAQDDAESEDKQGTVDTFAQYDQWRVFFNPVADQAEVDDTVGDLATQAGAVGFYIDKIVDRIDPALDESLDQITADMRAMVAARATIDQAADEVSNAPVLTRTAEGVQAMVTLVKPAAPAAIAGDVLAATDATGSQKADWLADEAVIAGAQGAWVDTRTLPRGAVDDPRVWPRPWPLDQWRSVAAWSQMMAEDPWASEPADGEPVDEAEEDIVSVWDKNTVAWNVAWPDGTVQPLTEISILDPTAYDELMAITEPWTAAVDNYVKLRETLAKSDLGDLVRQAIDVTATTQIVTVNAGVLKQFG
jgi:hypothetical protein